MFREIQQLPDDPILRLSQLCRDDARSHKIDVGVGIFIDEQGNTPVMRAVKAAEQRVWESQSTKKYQPLSGNPEFNAAMGKLVLGDAFDGARMRVNQSTGGTGALRVIGEVIAAVQPEATLWIPDPTWGNHMAVFAAAGVKFDRYPYLDPETCEVARDKVFAALAQLGDKDCVLLHGCCHNPSGADFSREDWEKIAQLANEKGFVPIIDFAYLGLGENLEDDAWGVRHVVKNVPQALIAVSCSKNFGLYRDRSGVIISVAENAEQVSALQTQVNAATRTTVSMSPDHPAAIVATILNDAALKADWEQELADMCGFIRSRREKLQAAMADAGGRDWSFITRHHGMFSLLPLGAEREQFLREEFAIYMVGTGRINLAGLRNDDMIRYFAESVKTVLART